MSNSTCIIIVTYNGMPWLQKCLDSCAGYPIIVVDNASTDGTVSYIETHYPNVELLKQAKNLGFGQANNLGIRYALDHGVEQVFLLNQDAYLMEDVLEKLIKFQNQHSHYGILSPIHITGNRNKLDKNFSNFMLKEKTGQFYSDFVLGNALAPIYEVPFVNAAAWLISRRCLETVGGFDPLFFHYGEDDNYCQRVAYHGLKIGVLPQCYIVHDREERPKIRPTRFSDLYFTVLQKKYFVNYANVLQKNTIDDKIQHLKRVVWKLQLQGRFKRATGFKTELIILKRHAAAIANSRAQNVTKGPHYL